MSSFLQLALLLALFIAAAKLGGYISLRLGQPSVLGEILMGLILGPTFLNVLHWTPFSDPHLGETIAHLAEIGVLLLMFIAGLDLHLSDMIKSGLVAASAGTMGVILPVAMGFAAGRFFQMDVLSSLFIGLILAATSVSISAQTLMELRVLRTRVGISLLGAAVFDDVLVVLGLSILIAVRSDAGTSLLGIGIIAARMVLYLAVGGGLGVWLAPRLSRAIDRLPISQGLIAFVFIVILLYGWSAEMIGGMAAITGAFLAGLVFARSPLKDRIETGVSTLAYAVFVPLFFINVGLGADGRNLLGEGFFLAALLILIAIISKVLGAGLGARIAGLSNRESLQLGAGMMSRGEVGLIVATLGMTEGLINGEIFSAVVEVVIVTTLLTPPALRILFRKPSGQPASAQK